MLCFWDEAQRAHSPVAEFFNGSLHPAADRLDRADAILAAIGSTEVGSTHRDDAILRVHGADYCAFLQTAHADWLAAGRSGEAFPYTFPIVGRRPLALQRIDARLGQYSFDTATPIGPGTWTATRAAVDTALSALDAIMAGERTAFALTRPPGHHAGADYCGGYSYLNYAAIAAEAALAAGRKRIAILDVDYHHGNGTQDIFYARSDVAYASIHANPVMDYPYYWGHADETGIGDGDCANLNLPLPRGTDWTAYRPAIDQAIEWIGRFQPELLIVSFGADTYAGDPISHFALETGDYCPMGRAIAALGLPTLIVMEGGYAVDALGANVAAFLDGF
ncbi:MAG: histone deacetylase family protein [Sphingomicrobium sp.]